MAKKVLFVATVVKTHMMQFHLPYLRMFQQMGWQTAVAARNDYENPADCQIPWCDAYFDIPFQRMPWKIGNFRAYRMLKEVIDQGDYDIIHCHTPVGAMLARLAARSARKRGTKVIYTAHGFHFFKGAPLMNWLLFYPVEWALSYLTDVLITINAEDYALAKKRLHPKQLAYVPGVGIDTSRFHLDETVRSQTRQELGFGPEDFLLLTVAEMTANKNHITVLKALAQLKQQPCYERMHYLICGRGEQWPALEQAAQELGVADHVHFLGYRQDAPRLYQAGDLFVFVPYREGLPVALMEAMASRMCVVCTEIRGNTDLVEDGKTGCFVENTPQALAQTIAQLYDQPEQRAALGAAAQRRAADFDQLAVLEQVKQLYLH